MMLEYLMAIDAGWLAAVGIPVAMGLFGILAFVWRVSAQTTKMQAALDARLDEKAARVLLTTELTLIVARIVSLERARDESREEDTRNVREEALRWQQTQFALGSIIGALPELQARVQQHYPQAFAPAQPPGHDPRRSRP